MIGKPFQGSIGYIEESEYGVAPSAETGTLLRFSDYVESATLRVADVNNAWRTIDTPSIALYTDNVRDFELEVTYLIQVGDAVLAPAITRATGNILPSYTIEIGTNIDSENKSYYLASGCKAKSIEVSGSAGEPYRATMTFSVAKVATATAAAGYIAGAALDGDVCTFNKAGSITLLGGAQAYVTDSITISVDNGITDLWNVGSTDKGYALEGELSVTGTSDISLDEGGKELWDKVLAPVPGDLVVTLGGTGAMVLTLKDTVYDNVEVALNSEGSGMMTGVPFTAKTIEISTVSA